MHRRKKNSMIRQNGVRKMTAPVAAGLLFLLGCAGKGDIIPMALNAKPRAQANGASQGEKVMSAPRIAVVPFEDGRSDRNNLGSRTSIWGGESYFDSPTIPVRVARPPYKGRNIPALRCVAKIIDGIH